MKLIFIVNIIFFFISLSYGQDTINVINVFENDYAEQSQSDRYIILDFKIDPLQLIAGDYSIYIEKKIGNHFALETSLGFTNNSANVFFIDVFGDEYQEYTNLKSTPGLSLSIQPKLYGRTLDRTTRAAPQGFYFTTQFRYRKHNLYNLDSVSRNLSFCLIDGRILFGYQHLAFNFLLLDCYLGAGYGCVLYFSEEPWEIVTLALGLKVGLGIKRTRDFRY